jgi:hypothetical protein
MKHIGASEVYKQGQIHPFLCASRVSRFTATSKATFTPTSKARFPATKVFPAKFVSSRSAKPDQLVLAKPSSPLHVMSDPLQLICPQQSHIVREVRVNMSEQ